MEVYHTYMLHFMMNSQFAIDHIFLTFFPTHIEVGTSPFLTYPLFKFGFRKERTICLMIMPTCRCPMAILSPCKSFRVELDRSSPPGKIGMVQFPPQSNGENRKRPIPPSSCKRRSIFP